jgi:hypothetical protein
LGRADDVGPEGKVIVIVCNVKIWIFSFVVALQLANYESNCSIPDGAQQRENVHDVEVGV